MKTTYHWCQALLLVTLLRAEDVAGHSQNVGKQQFFAENALAGLAKKRDGIPEELLDIKLDELELTPRCYHGLRKAGLYKVGDILDFFEKGDTLGGIENLSEKNAEEVLEALKKLGWES